MVALRRYNPSIEKQDPVKRRYGCQAMSYYYYGASPLQAAQQPPDPLLRNRVQRRRRLIEDQYPRLADQRPRYRYPLPFTTGKQAPTLTGHTLQA